MSFCRHWRNRAIEQTASLDRIDSSKGYIEGNIQWIHKELNWLKNDLDEMVLVDWCEKITRHKRPELFIGSIV